MQWMQNEIATPETMHGVSSPEEYKQRALEFSTRLGNSQGLRIVNEPIDAFVSHGRWIVYCPCHTGPSAHPDWGIACCYQCGRVYMNVVFPNLREDAERALLERPEPRMRNFFPSDGVARQMGIEKKETHWTLRAQNIRWQREQAARLRGPAVEGRG